MRSINFGLPDSLDQKVVGRISLTFRLKTTLETSGKDVKTTLETSGEDVKLHSKRVEKMAKLHSKRVEKIKLKASTVFDTTKGFESVNRSLTKISRRP